MILFSKLYLFDQISYIKSNCQGTDPASLLKYLVYNSFEYFANPPNLLFCLSPVLLDKSVCSFKVSIGLCSWSCFNTTLCNTHTDFVIVMACSTFVSVALFNILHFEDKIPNKFWPYAWLSIVYNKIFSFFCYSEVVFRDKVVISKVTASDGDWYRRCQWRRGVCRSATA